MLRLEALEHRYAPAAWTVNTLNDTPVANVNAHNAQDADGHVSLRSAIQQANFDGGSTSISFSVTGTISEANAMDSLNSDITIMGPGASSLTVARSSTASTDFSDIRVNANKTCLIFGLTFNSGTGSGGKGGGVYNDGDLDLVSCSVTNNSANLGGGIYNGADGTLGVEGCDVSSNTAIAGTMLNGYGGGIYNLGTVTVAAYTTIDGNTAATGGGGINSGPDATLSIYGSTTIHGNSSAGNGGGIYALGTLHVSASYITENTAVKGGGVYLTGCTATFDSDADIEYNNADKGGGAYLDTGSTTTFTNTTILNNSATTLGSGICYKTGVDYTISNCNQQGAIIDP